jgi:phosphoadenosine phosphosulfate reductase
MAFAPLRREVSEVSRTPVTARAGRPARAKSQGDQDAAKRAESALSAATIAPSVAAADTDTADLENTDLDNTDSGEVVTIPHPALVAARAAEHANAAKIQAAAQPTVKAPPAVPSVAELPVLATPAPEARTATPEVRTATPEELEWLKSESDKLEGADPREIIAWAVEHYQPKLGMATAFGPEGCVIIHMLAKIDPKTYVFNLDTGYQFAETLALRDRIAQRYGIEVELRRAAQTVAEYEAANGGPVYKSNPDKCCADRKLSVLRQASTELNAWMSGIRRDQSSDRARASIVGWDRKFGLVKVSPLANWTKAQVWKLITDENIPYNPLHDQGFTNIGCFPCTRAVALGEDERAGRWSGTGKTECGLHSLDSHH